MIEGLNTFSEHVCLNNDEDSFLLEKADDGSFLLKFKKDKVKRLDFDLTGKEVDVYLLFSLNCYLRLKKKIRLIDEFYAIEFSKDLFDAVLSVYNLDFMHVHVHNFYINNDCYKSVSISFCFQKKKEMKISFDFEFVV